MNLELITMVWLRVEKRCQIVIRERSPRANHCGQPDVLGVTANRYLVEVEIKRSVSDFRADGKKRHRRMRHLFPDLHPRQFYYLAPEPVASRILKDIPDWAGLLYVGTTGAGPFVMKVAPVNKESRRLTVIECCRLVPMLVNHILSAETSLDSERRRFRDGHQPWIPSQAAHYEI